MREGHLHESILPAMLVSGTRARQEFGLKGGRINTIKDNRRTILLSGDDEDHNSTNRKRGLQISVGAIPRGSSEQQSMIARTFQKNTDKAVELLKKLDWLQDQRRIAMADLRTVVNTSQYAGGMYVGCAMSHVKVDWNPQMMQNGDGDTPWVWQWTVKGGRQPTLVQQVCCQPLFPQGTGVP